MGQVLRRDQFLHSRVNQTHQQALTLSLQITEWAENTGVPGEQEGELPWGTLAWTGALRMPGRRSAGFTTKSTVYLGCDLRMCPDQGSTLDSPHPTLGTRYRMGPSPPASVLSHLHPLCLQRKFITMSCGGHRFSSETMVFSFCPLLIMTLSMVHHSVLRCLWGPPTLQPHRRPAIP